MITKDKIAETHTQNVIEETSIIEESIPNTPKKHKVIAPFKLLGHEPIYYLWIPMIVFSFLGVLISFMNYQFKAPFLNGTFYCTFITIMCPYVLEFFVELKVKKKSGIKQQFTYYKITSVVIAFCHIVFSGLVLGKELAQNILFESLYIVVSIVISLYIYLVFKMDNHPDYLHEYIDGTYAEQEAGSIRNIITTASTIKTTTTSNGRSVDL